MRLCVRSHYARAVRTSRGTPPADAKTALKRALPIKKSYQCNRCILFKQTHVPLSFKDDEKNKIMFVDWSMARSYEVDGLYNWPMVVLCYIYCLSDTKVVCSVSSRSHRKHGGYKKKVQSSTRKDLKND